MRCRYAAEAFVQLVPSLLACLGNTQVALAALPSHDRYMTVHDRYMAVHDRYTTVHGRYTTVT